MSISRDEALDALRQLERTETRTSNAHAYRIASGQLVLWGLIWVVGYSLSGAWPNRAFIVWPPLVLLGMAAGFLMVRRARRSAPGSADAGRRWIGQGVAITLFMYATYYVLPVTSAAQALVFPALVVAFIYALVGCVRLTRMLWIGAALFVLAMGGFVFLKPFIAFWLAAVGGGALIAGGLWLRSA